MFDKKSTMKIKIIEEDTDRKLLYGNDDRYCLIAAMNDDIKVGDTVEYEGCGVNFGWFKRVVGREG